jgi:hypothetical protein
MHIFYMNILNLCDSLKKVHNNTSKPPFYRHCYGSASPPGFWGHDYMGTDVPCPMQGHLGGPTKIGTLRLIKCRSVFSIINLFKQRDQCCGSGMFFRIQYPTFFFHPGSWIPFFSIPDPNPGSASPASKNLSVLT